MVDFSNRMDKSHISFGSAEEHDKEDRKYWHNATYEEKLKTITYLRVPLKIHILSLTSNN